jgi:hypothetical protein
MEKILHEIHSIWKNYYIIKFPWNKYYTGTNISSHVHAIDGASYDVDVDVKDSKIIKIYGKLNVSERHECPHREY